MTSLDNIINRLEKDKKTVDPIYITKIDAQIQELKRQQALLANANDETKKAIIAQVSAQMQRLNATI